MIKNFAFMGDQYVGGLLSHILQEAGYELAGGLDSADCILTYCVSTTQLEDCYLASGGAIESAREGCHLVDLSPSTPTFAKEIYAVARVNELQAVDAPLVVTDFTRESPFTDKDALVVFASGEDEAFAEVEPLLNLLAGTVRFVGAAGAGQLAKSYATMQQAASLVSLVEAAALAAREDSSATDALALLAQHGVLTSGALELFHAIEHGHFAQGYPCQALLADLTAVLMQADESELVLPLVEACQHLLELLVVVGGATLPAAGLRLAYASDEEGSAHGLDWSRAEGMFHHDHDHDHDHFDEDDYDLEYDEDDYDSGFGGFSAN